MKCLFASVRCVDFCLGLEQHRLYQVVSLIYDAVELIENEAMRMSSTIFFQCWHHLNYVLCQIKPLFINKFPLDSFCPLLQPHGPIKQQRLFSWLCNYVFIHWWGGGGESFSSQKEDNWGLGSVFFFVYSQPPDLYDPSFNRDFTAKNKKNQFRSRACIPIHPSSILHLYDYHVPVLLPPSMESTGGGGGNSFVDVGYQQATGIVLTITSSPPAVLQKRTGLGFVCGL